MQKFSHLSSLRFQSGTLVISCSSAARRKHKYGSVFLNFLCFLTVIAVIRQRETVVTAIKRILLVLEVLQVWLKESFLVIRRLNSFLISPLISVQTCSHPLQLLWDIDRKWTNFTPIHSCHCTCWPRSRPSIMPSPDHGEDSLSHSIHWLGKLVILIT